MDGKDSFNSVLLQEKVNLSALLLSVDNHEKPILMINPEKTGIYDFLHMNRYIASSYGMPLDLEKRIVGVKSVREISFPLEQYSMVLSGIIGSEIGTRDIGIPDLSTDIGRSLIYRCKDHGIGISIITQLNDTEVEAEIESLSNVIYFGKRPAEFSVFAYIMRCLDSGEIIDFPSKMVQFEQYCNDIDYQWQELDFYLRNQREE